MAVDRKGHGDHLTAPAGNQEDVRAPALVGGRLLNLPDVRPALAAVDPRCQHQPVQLHHASNAFAVVARPEGSVHHGPDAAVAIRRAAIGHGADLLQDRLIGGPVIAPVRARPGHVIGRPPGHAQHLADRDRQLGHRADSLRNDGVFFTISWAARRISTSIVFRPSARSSSRIFA